MTDFSKWTNEQINEAIFRANGWVKLPFPAQPCWQKPEKDNEYIVCWYEDVPNYTHDWRLAGELLEEMMVNMPVEIGNVTSGFMISFACCREVICKTLLRTICEAWLAWKGTE